MSLGKLIKSLAPIAISAFAGSQIGLGLGKLFGTQTALNPFLTRALPGAVTSKLMGGRNKDAVRNALVKYQIIQVKTVEQDNTAITYELILRA